MSDALTVAVLAGGASRRFGALKAFADWGGRPLARVPCDALGPGAVETMIVAKDTAGFGAFPSSVRLARDRFDERHALGGVVTALLESRTSHCFVCACDMPFVGPGLLEGLWERRREFQAVVPVWEGVRQPLCALYRRDAAGPLEESIAARRLSLQEALLGLEVLDVEGALLDPSGLAFGDLDTPADYAAARRRARLYYEAA